MERKEKLAACFQKYEKLIDDKKLEQFLNYYDLLIEWNSFMNLTAITDFDEVLEKHFLDSIKMIDYFDISKADKILDLGTGAGFPGIPLKILYPKLNFVLMDSLNKRIKFLNEVILQLGLSNITAIHGRAEEAAKNEKYREQFDFVVSRAVANLSTLSEYCIPFVKVNGMFLSYKSGKIEEELENGKKAIQILGGKCEEIVHFKLNHEIERTFIPVKKVKPTPKKYPRAGGKPSKEPL